MSTHLGRRAEPADPSSKGAASVATAAAAAPPPAALGEGLALEKMGDAPLRLVFIGHNPSAHAWSTGHFYSNPSNWFWRILKDTGVLPASLCTPAHDDDLPAAAGIGFTDVGSGAPSTVSAQFTSQQIFREWRPAFYARLKAQARRASAAAAADGCTCGFCGAPLLVAFTGVRQFAELFPGAAARSGSKRRLDGSAAAHPGCGAGEGSDGPASASASAPCLRLQPQRPSSIATGRQWVLPEGWPLPLDSAEVWVLTSTSGAAAMTREQRYQPWERLAERLAGEAWPRRCMLRCQTRLHVLQ